MEWFLYVTDLHHEEFNNEISWWTNFLMKNAFKVNNENTNEYDVLTVNFKSTINAAFLILI